MNEQHYNAPALFKGLKILESFNSKVRVQTTQTMAESLSVSPASLYRILATLVDLRYLTKVDRNTFKLGPAVASRGFAFVASRDIVDVASSYLNELRDEISMSCHIGIRDGRDCIYIYRALATQRLSVNVPIATRIPCHASALGRALLFGMSDKELSQLYFGFQLDSMPLSCPRSLPELRKQLIVETQQGYSRSNSDYATAIAIPVYSYTGEIVAAINTSGPDVFMKNTVTGKAVLQAITDTATAISQELGADIHKPSLSC